MRVLLIGAGGFIGGRVAARLIQISALGAAPDAPTAPIPPLRRDLVRPRMARIPRGGRDLLADDRETPAVVRSRMLPRHDGPIVLFDTDCVLCNGAVSFILAHERAPTLRFAGAWSEPGLALAARHGVGREELARTFLVILGTRALTRSDAALEIAQHLRAPWSTLWLLRALQRQLRDAGYDLVARHRYRLFGRQASCIHVPPAQRHRFIGVPGVEGGRS
jgi:predicted DCC family thiol-disulfide oxidoreductase YuxK